MVKRSPTVGQNSHACKMVRIDKVDLADSILLELAK